MVRDDSGSEQPPGETSAESVPDVLGENVHHSDAWIANIPMAGSLERIVRHVIVI